MTAEMLLMRLKENKSQGVDGCELRVLLSHIANLEKIMGSLLWAVTKAKVEVHVPFKETPVIRTRWSQDDAKAWGDESA